MKAALWKPLVCMTVLEQTLSQTVFCGCHCFAVHCCVGKLHALQNEQNVGFIDVDMVIDISQCKEGTELTVYR